MVKARSFYICSIENALTDYTILEESALEFCIAKNTSRDIAISEIIVAQVLFREVSVCNDHTLFPYGLYVCTCETH